MLLLVNSNRTCPNEKGPISWHKIVSSISNFTCKLWLGEGESGGIMYNTFYEFDKRRFFSSLRLRLSHCQGFPMLKYLYFNEGQNHLRADILVNVLKSVIWIFQIIL